MPCSSFTLMFDTVAKIPEHTASTVLSAANAQRTLSIRRNLRKAAEGELDKLGDTSTLLDPKVVDENQAGRL